MADKINPVQQTIAGQLIVTDFGQDLSQVCVKRNNTVGRRLRIRCFRAGKEAVGRADIVYLPDIGRTSQLVADPSQRAPTGRRSRIGIHLDLGDVGGYALVNLEADLPVISGSSNVMLSIDLKIDLIGTQGDITRQIFWGKFQVREIVLATFCVARGLYPRIARRIPIAHRPGCCCCDGGDGFCACILCSH